MTRRQRDPVPFGEEVWVIKLDPLPPVGFKTDHDNPREIRPPEGGWKPHTYYVVNVSFAAGNPIYRTIMYSGFIDNDGRPHNYSYLFCQGDKKEIHEARHISAVAELFTDH